MNLWKIIKPWIDKKYYHVSSMTILVSVLIFYDHFTLDKIKSEQDLICKEGKIVNYSFKHGNRGSKLYYFWLEGLKCTFQIPADFIYDFNEQLFISQVSGNDIIEVCYAKSRQINVNDDKKIIVFQIKSKYTTYLSKIDTIKRESKNSDIYAGIGFFLAGILYYILRKFIWKPKPV